MLKNKDFDATLLNTFMQGVQDYAIFALDVEGNIATWNAGAERAKGYTAEEIIGKHFSIFYTEDDTSRNHPQFELKEALANGAYQEEGWRVRKDGSLFWANVTITAVKDASGKHIGFAKITRDLTESKKASDTVAHQQKLLQESETAYEHIVDSVKEYAMFMLSPQGIIKSWNRGAERIKGYKPDEIIGKHFSIFYGDAARESKHPEWELEQAIKNGSYSEEGWRIRKDGSQFWANVTITAIFDKAGNNVGFFKVTRDLTERKQFEKELEEARDSAILANKLKSKFVANITHEIRTPLSGIVGLSELIADDETASENVQDSGERIFDASKRLLALLNDLLDFSKLEAGKMEIVESDYRPYEILDEVAGLVTQKAKDKGLKLEIDIDQNVPATLYGDSTKVLQILLNLVNNSVKFTEKGGIELSVEREGEFVRYSVTDTGSGIPEKVKSTLFKPFTQGHDPSFGGTGLGLSICQQFVELMGGEIGMVSETDAGTSVWFKLPLKEGEAVLNA